MAVTDLDVGPVSWRDWADDPYPLYRHLRDERPVFYDEPNDVYLVTRYEHVSALLADASHFANRHRVVDGERTLISPLRDADPPEHTVLRRIIMPMFTPAEMRRLETYYRDVACALLDDAEQTDVVEVSSQLAVPLPGRVTCDLLGLPLELHDRFLDLTTQRRVLAKISSASAGDDGTARSADDLRADMWELVREVVAERRARPQHDAISLLVAAQQHDGDEAEARLLVDMLLQLLTGGFHTTQHLVEMLLSLLADRHDLWEQLRENRDLVPAAIEEMLRYDAPVQAIPRRAVAGENIGGVMVPADAELMLVLGAANRDERVFEDPDIYTLDRKGKRHMAFGAGIHYCPGAPVTRFEVRALLDEMLDRYECIERAGPSVRWPVISNTVTAMHGFEFVPVHLRAASARA